MIGALEYGWFYFYFLCVWIVWGIFRCIQVVTDELVYVCNSSLAWFICILCCPILSWLCNFIQVFVWGGVHISPHRILLRNCLPLVWVVLIAIHVSRIQVIICFVVSRFCQVFFLGVCWVLVRNEKIRTCRNWRQYIPHLFRLFFLWVCIMLWSHLRCLWRVCGCIQVFQWCHEVEVGYIYLHKLDPFVYMTLLNRILETSILSVGVATSPVYSVLSPLTVDIVPFFSFFSGQTMHMNCPYVTSFLWLCGIYFLMMNVIVLVGIFMRPPTPFVSRPNLFSDDVLQFFLYFGFINSFL